MFVIGREENESFERRFLGPRGVLDLEADCEIETSDEVTARFKSAHTLLEEKNPWGGDNQDVAKALAQHERDEAQAHAETLQQWRDRVSWGANKTQAAAEDEIPPADRPNNEQSWADQRLADGYAVPSGGTRFERDVADMTALVEFRVSEGVAKAEVVSALRKITANSYSQAVIDAAELAAA